MVPVPSGSHGQRCGAYPEPADKAMLPTQWVRVEAVGGSPVGTAAGAAHGAQRAARELPSVDESYDFPSVRGARLRAALNRCPLPIQSDPAGTFHVGHTGIRPSRILVVSDELEILALESHACSGCLVPPRDSVKQREPWRSDPCCDPRPITRIAGGAHEAAVRHPSVERSYNSWSTCRSTRLNHLLAMRFHKWHGACMESPREIGQAACKCSCRDQKKKAVGGRDS